MSFESMIRLLRENQYNGPSYPWPDPTNKRIKQLEAELAAKDGENERLRERILRKECISRLPNCTDAGMGDDTSVVGYCPIGCASGEYCDAVRKVVEQ